MTRPDCLANVLQFTRKGIQSEIRSHDFRLKQASENREDARKLGDQKRLLACDQAILISEISRATLGWVLQIMAHHEEMENHELHIEAEKAKALQVAKETEEIIK